MDKFDISYAKCDKDKKVCVASNIVNYICAIKMGKYLLNKQTHIRKSSHVLIFTVIKKKKRKHCINTELRTTPSFPSQASTMWILGKAPPVIVAVEPRPTERSLQQRKMGEKGKISSNNKW